MAVIDLPKSRLHGWFAIATKSCDAIAAKKLPNKALNSWPMYTQIQFVQELFFSKRSVEELWIHKAN